MNKPTCGEQGYTLTKHTPAQKDNTEKTEWEQMNERNSIKMTDKICAVTE